jgi:uncharacterized membrane protein SpoIIM required for sporulation
VREGLFIKKNKDRWERLQMEEEAGPDEMAASFTRLVDDLAYAKTFYPTSRVTRYINVLASRIYLRIYQSRKEESNRLLHFWKYDVPLTVAKHYKSLLFAFGIFLLFYGIGFFTSLKDDAFARSVFGEEYINKTEENIESGNPFGIYQSGNSFFLMIAFFINNTIVCFINFVKGILLGFLSLTSLARESMRFGVFHHMFYAKGYGLAFYGAVMLHGLLELTAIIVSCGAGLAMGISVIFPGTDRRWAALKQGVKDGVKIVVGLVPVLFMAAFFEGFVTRHYKMPVVLNLLLLGASATFIIWYFILYPIRLRRRGVTGHTSHG